MGWAAARLYESDSLPALKTSSSGRCLFRRRVSTCSGTGSPITRVALRRDAPLDDAAGWFLASVAEDAEVRRLRRQPRLVSGREGNGTNGRPLPLALHPDERWWREPGRRSPSVDRLVGVYRRCCEDYCGDER